MQRADGRVDWPVAGYFAEGELQQDVNLSPCCPLDCFWRFSFFLFFFFGGGIVRCFVLVRIDVKFYLKRVVPFSESSETVSCKLVWQAVSSSSCLVVFAARYALGLLCHAAFKEVSFLFSLLSCFRLQEHLVWKQTRQLNWSRLISSDTFSEWLERCANCYLSSFVEGLVLH